MPPVKQNLSPLYLRNQTGGTSPAPPHNPAHTPQSGAPSTIGRVASALAPNSFLKACGWTVTLLGGAVGAAVGLEAYGKAPWQSNPESTPIATALDNFARVKLPALLSRKKEGARSEPEAAANPVPAPVAEIPNREVLQAGFEKISDILFDRAGSLAPEIDLSSPTTAKNTIRKFAQAITQMPRELPQRYLLWDAIRAIAKDVDKPEGALKLNETVEAIAANKPVPQQPADTTWKWNFEPPKPVSNAPFSKASANGQYYELKADAIPALKSYLTSLDVLLRVNGLAIPQPRLDNARSAMGTLFDYSDALRKLDLNHPEIARVRRIGDGLGRSALTTETIKELKEQHTLAKALEAEYQAALPQLSPLLGTLLDKISSGLEVSGQKVPERHLKTIPAAVETLLRFQKAVRRIAPESSDVSMLGDIAAGLWTAPKDQVDGLKAFLDMKDKPSPASKPPPPASNTDLPKPPVPGAELEEPPVPIKTPPETPARGKR